MEYSSFAITFLTIVWCLNMCVQATIIPTVHAAVSNCSLPCDPTQCPAPPTCKQTIVKDVCSCCLICPPARKHPIIAHDGACSQVTCTGRKICIVNMQGLPLCKCPSEELCHGDPREPVCGSDRVLYYSPCHKRLQECWKSKKINEVRRRECHFRQNHKGLVVSMKTSNVELKKPRGLRTTRPVLHSEQRQLDEGRNQRHGVKARFGRKKNTRGKIEKLKVKIKRMEDRKESTKNGKRQIQDRRKGATANNQYSKKKLQQLRSKLVHMQYRALSRQRRKTARQMYLDFLKI